MPKKFLALLLGIIVLFAFIDLARSAKTQLAQAFSNHPPLTIADAENVAVPTPTPTASITLTPAGLAKASIVPATWDRSATR